jgi:hypothetical protein
MPLPTFKPVLYHCDLADEPSIIPTALKSIQCSLCHSATLLAFTFPLLFYSLRTISCAGVHKMNAILFGNSTNVILFGTFFGNSALRRDTLVEFPDWLLQLGHGEFGYSNSVISNTQILHGILILITKNAIPIGSDSYYSSRFTG